MEPAADRVHGRGAGAGRKVSRTPCADPLAVRLTGTRADSATSSRLSSVWVSGSSSTRLVDAVAGQRRGRRAALRGRLELLGAQPLLLLVVALDPARARAAPRPCRCAPASGTAPPARRPTRTAGCRIASGSSCTAETCRGAPRPNTAWNSACASSSDGQRGEPLRQVAQLALPAHAAAARLGDPAQQRGDVGDRGDRGVLQAFGLAVLTGAEPLRQTAPARPPVRDPFLAGRGTATRRPPRPAGRAGRCRWPPPRRRRRPAAARTGSARSGTPACG